MFTPFFMAYHSKSLGFMYSFIFFVFWNLLFHFVSLHVPSVIFLWHCWYFTHTVKFLHSRAQIINIDAFMLILWVEIFVKKKSSAFYDTATRRICRRLGCSHFKKKQWQWQRWQQLWRTMAMTISLPVFGFKAAIAIVSDPRQRWQNTVVVADIVLSGNAVEVQLIDSSNDALRIYCSSSRLQWLARFTDHCFNHFNWILLFFGFIWTIHIIDSVQSIFNLLHIIQFW